MKLIGTKSLTLLKQMDNDTQGRNLTVENSLQISGTYVRYMALRANNRQYVCAEGGGGSRLVANRDAIGPWESFKLIDATPPD